MITRPTRFICAVLLPFVVLACAPESSRDRTISVVGTAVTRTIPDTVVWHVTTTSAFRDLVRAKEESDKQMQAILTTVRELGVDADDMQTGYLDVSKEYERNSYGSIGELKHFRVTRLITIKERDTARFDMFLTRLIKSADMDVRYTLETSKIHEIRTKTRLEAVAITRTKAEAMAGELGASVGEVLSVVEQGERGYGMANRTSWDGLQLESGKIDESTGTFAPGSIEVQVSVGVVFELR